MLALRPSPPAFLTVDHHFLLGRDPLWRSQRGRADSRAFAWRMHAAQFEEETQPVSILVLLNGILSKAFPGELLCANSSCPVGVATVVQWRANFKRKTNMHTCGGLW